MGITSGRLTCVRYRVQKTAPPLFGPEQLEALSNFTISRARTVTADGTSFGWTAGDHILDTQFELAKNIVNDTLQFSLRVDSQRVPGDLLRAYTQVELAALAAANPSGLPSTRQKREARETARERLEAEATDGRYTRRKEIPLLWDLRANELLVGSTSVSALEHLLSLYRETFDSGLELLSAGRQAYLQAEARRQQRGVDDAKLPTYVPGTTSTDVAWLPDETNRDFLGNEFLLWLWYVLENESDTLTLADESEATVMLAKTLALECPRGITGKESITSDGPTRLPEALRAIQAGKLPRKVGLIVVRHETQYELALHAETLAITGAKLPTPEGDNEQARREERVQQVRHLLETIDLLFDAFGNHRFGANWSKELLKIQQWLARGERRQSATA